MDSIVAEKPGIKYELIKTISDQKTEKDITDELTRYISNQLPRYILDEPEETWISHQQLKLHADMVSTTRIGKQIKVIFTLYQNNNGSRDFPNDRLKEVMDKKISKITEYEIKEV